MKTKLILICLLVGAVACGGEEPAATSATATTAPATTDTTPPAPATTVAAAPSTAAADTSTTVSGSAPATINITGFAFSGPATVSVGDTVEVVNNDGVPHTWTSKEEGVFNLSLGGGDRASFTFEQAGEFDFFCSIHPSMTGTITVEG